jgi:hypothetical protein
MKSATFPFLGNSSCVVASHLTRLPHFIDESITNLYHPSREKAYPTRQGTIEIYITLMCFKYLNMNGLIILDGVPAHFNNVPDSNLIVTTDFKIKLIRSVNRYPEDGSRTNTRKVV